MPHGDSGAGAPSVVEGLSRDEQEVSAAAYFAAFVWEPPFIDPAHLTASEFFTFVLGEAAPEVGASESREATHTANRYLDSVDVELLDDHHPADGQ